jgi:uncharacterized damage-inducible protein DinB
MESYLSSAIKQFKYYENLGSRTLAQLSDEELVSELALGVNSIAIIVKHMHGNMLSRWVDFLTSDGEKESRDRDGEFEQTFNSRAEIERAWSDGWQEVYNALEPLTQKDLERTVYIRNEGHSVVEAVNRQLCHYAYHVGQIVFIGKVFRKDDWQSLSIPKDASKLYNTEKFSKEKGKSHFTDSEMN